MNMSARATQLYLGAANQRQAAQESGADLIRLCDDTDQAAAELARECLTQTVAGVLYLCVGYGNQVYAPEEGLGEA